MAFNCPVCGAPAPENLQFAKLLVCSYCKTSLFLEDAAVKDIGIKSAIVEQPSIFQLGQHYRYHSMSFEPYGRIQFDHGDGYWDEWGVMTDRGEGKWISVDEGDIAIESSVESIKPLPDCLSLRVHENIVINNQNLKVTEVDTSSCIAVEGQLPEIIFPGDEHHYAHLSGAKNLLLTLECFGNKKALYKGIWIDPFEVKPLTHYGHHSQ